MKDKLFTLMTLCILTACVNTKSESSANNDDPISFQNGDLMTDVSEDSLGNPLTYPTGEAAVTSQVKVWKPGFTSPWHYHPYTGIAYVVQGELTVNFDSNTSLEDISAEKTVSSSQTFKAGDKAFLGVSNTWHYSESSGSEELIFIVSWLGEKGSPIAVMGKTE